MVMRRRMFWTVMKIAEKKVSIRMWILFGPVDLENQVCTLGFFSWVLTGNVTAKS